MDWFFNGLGTAIIGLIIGAIGGSVVGYRIGIKKNTRQSQKARDYVSQVQIGENNHGK
jgi:Na+/glutamate symporter